MYTMSHKRTVQSIKALHFDTFEEHVKSRILSSISPTNLAILNADPYEWNDLYIEFVVNLYASLTECRYFQVVYVDCMLLEPIVLFVDAEDKITDNPSITHAVSRLFLRNIFAKINTYTITQCNKNKLEFVPPAVFSKSNINFAFAEDTKLSITLTEKLLKFYIVAEHAAYHYSSFMNRKDCDYMHLHFNEPDKTKRPSRFYDLLSAKPNKKVSNYTENHQVIRREDGEHAEGFVNDYASIFRVNSSKKIDDDTSDSSSEGE